MVNTWELEPGDQFERDIKRMAKRYPREVKQMYANLMDYLANLNQCDNPLLMAHFSYVHRETSGCHAITQQPLKSAAQTRLYIYAYAMDHLIHLICVGDKHSQQKDNEFCRQYVRNLK